MNYSTAKSAISVLSVRFFFLFLMLFLVWQPSAFSAQLRTLNVQLTFDASTVTGKTLAGYRLYEDSKQVCETTDPQATVVSCVFTTENGTHTYELSAYYSDGSESPKSSPYEFTISDTGQKRTLEVALSFDAASLTGKTVAGYRLYEDSQPVCETSDPSATTIVCNFDTQDGVHSYQLSALFADGTESPKSSPVLFTVGDPGLVETLEIDVPSDIEISTEKTLVGFRVYIDSTLTCQTTDPSATTLSCNFLATDGSHSYEIAAYYADETEGAKTSATEFTTGGSEPVTQLRTLVIAVSFDSSAQPEKIHVGYRLYEDSIQVCETDDPTASAIACEFLTADGTHTYEVAALYADGTESSKSQPFEFTIGDTSQLSGIQVAIPDDLGTLEGKTLSGYKLYVDSALICESTDPAATSIFCSFLIEDGVHMYEIATSYTDGSEGPKSSPVQFTTGAGGIMTTLEVNLSFDPSLVPDKTLAGYRLYEDSRLVCETIDPIAQSILCGFVTVDGSHSYELAAYYTDGTESPKSEPFLFTVGGSSGGGTGGELVAAISATPLTGTTPLSVTFNGSASTGNINAYSWDFGDGDKGSGVSVSHIYDIPGSYSITLEISDSLGSSALASATITAEEGGSGTNQPPEAVISSSTAAGEVPLEVVFDGSASTATNANIITYDWLFGDGTSATGKSISHIFSVPGTYNTQLTVTDSNGLTDSATTPVLVSESSKENQLPQAAFSVDTSQGSEPLTVNFNGSLSSDADGSITAYAWNFGDGATGTGQTVQHTYTAAASYVATLQVTDDMGGVSQYASKTITVEEQQQPVLNYEIGEISINHEWVRVQFENVFVNPAVFVGPPSYNDKQGVVVRVRNVTANGFDVRLQEWDYLDGNHASETVNFIVLERGQVTLPDGTMLEVGVFNGSTNRQTITFKQSFKNVPVVLTTIMSENESDAVTGRIGRVRNTDFVYYFQEQEKTKNKHVDESVAYLAWEAGSGTVDNINYSAVLPATNVSSNPTTILFEETYQDKPFLFTEMQSANDQDTAALRILSIGTDKFELLVEEEQSKDNTVDHSAESVGYLTITPVPLELN